MKSKKKSKEKSRKKRKRKNSKNVKKKNKNKEEMFRSLEEGIHDTLEGIELQKKKSLDRYDAFKKYELLSNGINLLKDA